MLICSKCKEPIVSITKRRDWLAIFNFFGFLYHEKYIEEATYQDMMGNLQTFKDFCFDENGNEI